MIPSKTKKPYRSTTLKKSYSSPLLTSLGAIQELTAGGTGGPPEAMPNQTNKQLP